MQKYQVIPLAVSGHSNKVFKSGDIVVASDFVEDNVEELVRQGFLLPLSAEPEATAENTPAEPAEDQTSDNAKKGRKK